MDPAAAADVLVFVDRGIEMPVGDEVFDLVAYGLLVASGTAGDGGDLDALLREMVRSADTLKVLHDLALYGRQVRVRVVAAVASRAAVTGEPRAIK